MKNITDSYNEIFGEKNSALFIFAHPDDAEIYSGGIIKRLTNDGKKVGVVKMTNGNKGSRQEKISISELTKIRRDEDSDSMRILGINEENNFYLDLEDGGVEDSIENIEKLVRVIRKFKPDIIITHNPEDVIIRHSEGINWVNHRDHMNTGKLATYAAYPYSRDLSFFPDHFSNPELSSHSVTEFLYVDSFNHPDEVFFDVTKTVEDKIKSISAHKSQYSVEAANDSAEFFTNHDDSGLKFERFRYTIID